MTLSVIIPVYNEERTIREIINRVKNASTNSLGKEIVVIDDGSTDGTKGILRNIQGVKIIYKDKNEGKGAAVREGFKNATGDIILIQDADLEYNPDEITRLLSPLLAGEKVIYGSRYLEKNKNLSFWHTFSNRLFTKFGNLLTGQNLTDIVTCYKAFHREITEKLKNNLESDDFGFDAEITVKVSRLGYKIKEVPISYKPRTRKEGKKLNFWLALKVFFTLIKYAIR